MTADQDKLQKLLEKRQQLDNRIKKQKNMLEHRERQDDTRRKILAGAFLLEEYKDKMDELRAKMDRFLSRPQDRALFGLDPTTNRTN